SDLLTLSHPLLANTIKVRHEPHATVAEVEPNDRLHPQRVSLPCTLSGRIDSPDDRDVFEFAAKKGQNLLFQVEARIFNSPLTPALRLTDAAGKTLAQAGDTN